MPFGETTVPVRGITSLMTGPRRFSTEPYLDGVSRVTAVVPPGKTTPVKTAPRIPRIAVGVLIT